LQIAHFRQQMPGIRPIAPVRLACVRTVPFDHPKLDRWRDALHAGVEHHDERTNLIITGGIDDVWIDRDEQLLVADYKATAKVGEVTLDAEWQNGYKRQIEIYQWLFRRNGFRVSNTGYFVYCNGDTSRSSFENRVDFKVKLIPYVGRDSWVDRTILDLAACLKREDLPDPGARCDFCKYRAATKAIEGA
jgi:RecB family exonuclease